MSVELTLVVAMTPDRVIGRDGGMPWHLPADLAHFKRVTLGHPVIMGRRTYESIGRPLPGRENVVVTRDRDYRAEGCTLVHSLEDALAGRDGELMLIGGGQLYREALPAATRIHQTLIHAEIAGDTRFPELDEGWTLVAEDHREPDEHNAHRMSFRLLERR